jgi:hypothetical protein
VTAPTARPFSGQDLGDRRLQPHLDALFGAGLAAMAWVIAPMPPMAWPQAPFSPFTSPKTWCSST